MGLLVVREVIKLVEAIGRIVRRLMSKIMGEIFKGLF